MPKIWEHNRLYSFLRPYVDLCTRASYSRLSVKGTLPRDGAVIIAPNHCNTLMDALVVLQSRREETVFGARADIFSKPAANSALRFLKILPMARERDGMAIQMASFGTFEEIEDTLASGIPFCMFPEGKHTPGREVQSLRKGIVRIALRSATSRKTLIVPAGLNYSSFFRFRGSASLVYGEPLDVNAFLESHPELSGAELTSAILEELHGRLQALVSPQGPEFHPRLWEWPLWPAAALFSLPIWLPAEILTAKLKDKAFSNSVRYLFKLLLTPPVVIAWAAVLFVFLPWWIALPLCIYALFSVSIFYDCLAPEGHTR